ncbi:MULTISPECIES: glycosyltransferase family protein [Pseudovibrio]|uniref:glycosyltransferase family protein n=1 Tax=Stappiaceae TaxID=2821832 RepID=UPI002365026A|nr:MULTISPECIES: glycosyltransferase [Pseudovibrio]MDD7909110.1 glycosyltransferase [Pseudovibrio exalbescens]MDX5593568.1 glycosyltransferase [Pseudovibrio sp. SPO723]
MKAFIHVQHLLGTGHVVRAAAIGRALAARGVEVTLASGNTVPPTLNTHGLNVVELPPVRSPDAVFDKLVTPDGTPIDDSWFERRTQTTLEAFQADDFDILLTETYPFGRRQFEQELSPLLRFAKAQERPPLIASSIRDILVRKQQLWKEEWMAKQAARYYDCVLVHSDPEFVRLSDSFPFAQQVEHLLRYTGYVDAQRDTIAPSSDGHDEVIVSCGGGAVGAQLLESALIARSLSRRAGDTTWRVLVGHDINEETFAALQLKAHEGCIVERARPDFPELLTRARLSVSQAGYNTVLDVLVAGVAAVFVPFAQVRETEQAQRAEALVQRQRAVSIPEDTLTPEGLAAAVDDALSLPRSDMTVLLGGAERSADILIAERERQVIS